MRYSLQPGTNLDQGMKDLLREFVTICYSRLEKGEEKRDNYLKVDLYQEITEELADVANYAFLEYVKLRKLREKTEAYRNSVKEREDP